MKLTPEDFVAMLMERPTIRYGYTAVSLLLEVELVQRTWTSVSAAIGNEGPGMALLLEVIKPGGELRAETMDYLKALTNQTFKAYAAEPLQVNRLNAYVFYATYMLFRQQLPDDAEFDRMLREGVFNG